MPHLTTVHVQYESKIEILGQKQVYGEDLRSLTSQTKIWHNNHISRRFGIYSFLEHRVQCSRGIEKFKNKILITWTVRQVMRVHYS